VQESVVLLLPLDAHPAERPLCAMWPLQGRSYYHNPTTGVSQYENPFEFSSDDEDGDDKEKDGFMDTRTDPSTTGRADLASTTTASNGGGGALRVSSGAIVPSSQIMHPRQ
jgi:hypothetical protein